MAAPADVDRGEGGLPAVLTRTLAGNLILAILVAFLARLSMATTGSEGYGPSVWLPAGLATAVVLRWGYGLLPGAFLGSGWLDLAFVPGLGAPPAELTLAGRLGFASAMTLDAWLGAFLIRWFLPAGDPFRTTGGVIKALVLGAVCGSLPGLAILPFLPIEEGLKPGWQLPAGEFVLAQICGFLVLAPLVMFNAKAAPHETRSPIAWWEASLIWGGVAGSAAMMVLNWPGGQRPILDPFLFGIVAWSAVRLAYPYPVLVAGAAGAQLVFGTAAGIGPLVTTGWPSPLLLASLHQIVMSLLALTLAALASSGRAATFAVARSDELLRQLQALAENSPDSGILVYDRDMRVLVARVADSVPLPFNPADSEGRLLAELGLPGWNERESLYRAPLEGRSAQAEFNLYGRIFRGYFLPVVLGDGGVTSGIAIWQDISEKRRLERELQESQIRLQDLARHLMAVREEERTRIARTVHDSIGQTLTGIKLDVAWLARRCGSGLTAERDHEDVQVRLADLAAQADQAVAQARDLASELRPGVLDHLGLAAAITWQADEYRKRSDLAIDVTFTDGPTGLSRDAETSVFRVLQELLHNAVRHSQCNHVWITLDLEGESLILEVEDDGQGLAPKSGRRGFGLDDVRERARQLGGTFEIQGEPGQGTRAILRVPFDTQPTNGQRNAAAAATAADRSEEATP